MDGILELSGDLFKIVPVLGHNLWIWGRPRRVYFCKAPQVILMYPKAEKYNRRRIEINTRQTWPFEIFPALRFHVGWFSERCQKVLENFRKTMKMRS